MNPVLVASPTYKPSFTMIGITIAVHGAGFSSIYPGNSTYTVPTSLITI